MKSVKLSMVLTNIIMVCIVAVSIGAVALAEMGTQNKEELSNYEEAVRQGYDDSIKYQVQNVISLLDGIYARQQAGELTEEEAKAEAKQLVKSLRYNGDGYFWIDDTDYILVAHPMLEEQEGTNRFDTTDQNGVKLIQAIVKTATTQPEGGFNEFWFSKPGQEEPAPKRAYSMLFAPYNWIISTGNYVDDMDADILNRTAQMSSRFQRITLLLISCIVFCMIVAAVGAFLLAGGFTRPLKKIQELAKRLSNGDFSQSIELHRRDEFGQTAKALDTAQNNIRSLVREIMQVTESIETAINRLHQVCQNVENTTSGVTNAIADMAQGAMTQAESTEDATKHVAQMGENIHNTVNYVEALNKQAGEMEVSSKEALNTIQELGRINARTRQQIQTIYEQTGTTNDSVQKIKQATELINSIAEETNLLSLNASIEAARAGEAGRGFAVVADQISKLADQSSESAQQIEEVVRTLLENSDKEVEIMTQVKEVIEQESGELDKTQQIFASVYEGIGASIQAVHQIAEKAESLDAVRGNVIDIVSTLSSIAEENAASTQATSASTTELNSTMDSIAGDMNRLKLSVESLSAQVGRFRV
ncbi:MAG: methyl-accepting chemotaxis protein [Clostridiales bacterium]|nr:methyl-accepting chemotaxis protein [Clostridiales bacterium]